MDRREGAYLLLADIEEAETGDQGKVRQLLSKAVRAPRDPAWVADGVVSERWAPVSPVTGKLDAFEWRAPMERLGQLIDSHEDVPDEPQCRPLRRRPGRAWKPRPKRSICRMFLPAGLPPRPKRTGGGKCRWRGPCQAGHRRGLCRRADRCRSRRTGRRTGPAARRPGRRPGRRSAKIVAPVSSVLIWPFAWRWCWLIGKWM